MPPLAVPAADTLSVDPQALQQASRHTATCADDIRAYSQTACSDIDLTALTGQWGALGEPVIAALRTAIAHHQDCTATLAGNLESTATTLATHAASYASTDAATAAGFTTAGHPA